MIAFMPRLSLRQNVIAGYAAALLVCVVGWLGYRSARAAVDTSVAARQVQGLVSDVRTVSNGVRDAESMERGFLLTTDTRYMGPYRNAVDGTREALGRLRSSAARYPGLGSRVDSLGYFVGLELAELDETMRLQRDMGTKAAVAVVRSQRGTESMAQISRLIDSLDAGFVRSSAGAEAQSSADAQLVLIGVATAGAIALVLALLINILHSRNVREQRRITEELETQSFQLQIQATELQVANTELENATRELVMQTIEAERNEMRLAGILSSATDAVVSFDDDGKIVYFNSAAERLLDGRGEQLSGLPISRFIAERSARGLEEGMIGARRAAHSGTPSPELWDTLIEHEGIEVPVEVSMAYARTGKQGLFTAVLRDVTRQRQLEEEVRQSQKMEAVGRLAGGIAHDFNNLLTVIGASSDFLMFDLKGESNDLRKDVTEIKRATDRAAALTRQLLAFSRRQIVQPQLLDLNSVVSEMETMLRRLIGEDVTLSTEYCEDMGLALLDRGQLEQVVVNLVVNARDAMPGGGVVRVRTGNERGGSVNCTAPAGSVRNEFVTLTVGDTGVGMDEPTRSRIFEPFFTTKEQGKGTGLGLSTVYGIVKQAGGDILLSSEIDEGTEFKIFFPRMEDDLVPAPPPLAPPDTLRGYETVLVVEDEEALRRLTRRMLESRGYTVLEAANGQEAIRVMASCTGRVDLVLSDVVMPGMSGRQMVERLLPVYPWMRVLFMSGYTEDMMLQHRVAELGITVLEKPFSGDDLALAVRNTLDRVTETAEVGR